MKGSLAQVIAIIAHGNAWLTHANDEKPSDLLDANSTFQYVRDIAFLTGTPENPIGLHQWFENLTTPSPTLRLWGENVTEVSGSHLRAWTPTWSVTTSPRPRIWSVAYRPTDRRGDFPTWDLSSAAHSLRSTLGAIRAFAKRESPSWAEWFELALEQLDSPRPRARFHDDALPPLGYSLEARQVFAASVNSWVFGGMGSWNDWAASAELETEYRKVSDDLYSAMMQGFHASVNSWPGTDEIG